MWQDITITICILLFSYALIPQILQAYRAKRSYINMQTSLITSLALYVTSFCFLTVNLYFSSFMNVITGTLWALMFIQGIIYRKK